MRFFISVWLLSVSLFPFSSQASNDQAKIMNPGVAVGQLVMISENDMKERTEKYLALSAYSIPVFAELPLELSVVAGAVTLKQQNLLSHVQIKSRARKTPNLDISDLDGGLSHPLFKGFKDGDWIRFELKLPNEILIQAATEQEAIDFYNSKKSSEVSLVKDLTAQSLYTTTELGWRDFDKVGSKAANYAELAKALNTPDRMVVRPGFAIPFYYYALFLEENPEIQSLIQKTLRDPLMSKVAKVSYRQKKLEAIQTKILDLSSHINENFLDRLISLFDTARDSQGQLLKLKLRSSTNSEDLPNFNGAGLYTSESYKPIKKGKERSFDEKKAELSETLKTVWASIWNLRAYDERSYFGIPHADVYMGIQVNPSFSNEIADGVIVTKNVAQDSRFTEEGVYIEAQRGDKHSVANPEPGVKPERLLVVIDPSQPLNSSVYEIHLLQNSNIADDGETILPEDNPHPILKEGEIRDLVFQSLKAEDHFRPLLGENNPSFSLDLEFKVDQEVTGQRQVFLKQARPYIE